MADGWRKKVANGQFLRFTGPICGNIGRPPRPAARAILRVARDPAKAGRSARWRQTSHVVSLSSAIRSDLIREFVNSLHGLFMDLGV